MVPPSASSLAVPERMSSKTVSSCSPRYTERMAGGASLAPRRWSLLAEAMTARSRGPKVCTPRITAPQNSRKLRFSSGVLPGSSRLPWVEFPTDQLTCLPDPLIPAKGFSWSRHMKPWALAVDLMIVIMSCWWSAATLAASK